VNVYTNIKSYDKKNVANEPLLASCDNLVKEPLNKFSSFAIIDKKINIVNTKKDFNQVILSEFDFAKKKTDNNDYKAKGNIVLLKKKQSKAEKTEEKKKLSKKTKIIIIISSILLGIVILYSIVIGSLVMSFGGF
jgi:hypothetical protein